MILDSFFYHCVSTIHQKEKKQIVSLIENSQAKLQFCCSFLDSASSRMRRLIESQIQFTYTNYEDRYNYNSFFTLYSPDLIAGFSWRLGQHKNQQFSIHYYTNECEQNPFFSENKTLYFERFNKKILHKYNFFFYPIKKDELTKDIYALLNLQQFLDNLCSVIKNIQFLENNYINDSSLIIPYTLVESYFYLIESTLADTIFMTYMGQLYEHQEKCSCLIYSKKINEIEETLKSSIRISYSDPKYIHHYFIRYDNNTFVDIMRYKLSLLDNIQNFILEKKLSTVLPTKITIEKKPKI